MKTQLYTSKTLGRLMILLTLFTFSTFKTVVFAQSATGEVVYVTKNKPVNLTVTSGQYLTGPDEMEAAKTIRRLLFTSSDITTKVKTCKTLKCLDSEFIGLQVDITDGPRLLYWLVLNNQLVQYSGTAQPETLALTQNSPTHLAGSLAIDDSKAGGPKIDIKFDLNLNRAFEK